MEIVTNTMQLGLICSIKRQKVPFLFVSHKFLLNSIVVPRLQIIERLFLKVCELRLKEKWKYSVKLFRVQFKQNRFQLEHSKMFSSIIYELVSRIRQADMKERVGIFLLTQIHKWIYINTKNTKILKCGSQHTYCGERELQVFSPHFIDIICYSWVIISSESLF